MSKLSEIVDGPPNHVFHVNGQALHISVVDGCLQITSNVDLGVRDGNHVRKHHTMRLYLQDHLLMGK